jgi:type VI secretion system VasI family protein
MTDQTTVMAALQSDDNHGFTGKPVIWLRCNNNRTEMAIDLKDGIAFDGDFATRVKIRFDSTTATNYRLSNAKGLTQTYFFGGAISLAKKLTKHTTMRVQYSDPLGKRQLTTWTLTGADEAIKPVRAACGW